MSTIISPKVDLLTVYQKIITHEDFDGLISAVICSHSLKVNHIEFTGPRTVSDARISITENDVVCDLPYPLECALWFDHHTANLEELEYRGIDPAALEGKFDTKDSCARVVYEYFLGKRQLPAHFLPMVDEADVIDAFKYSSIDDWRMETPGKVIDGTIKLQHREFGAGKWKYLRDLVQHLKRNPIEVVATMPAVKKRYQQFCEEEQQMLEQIRVDSRFLPEDTDNELVVIDLTKHNRRPYIVKHLAYLIYPEAKGVIEVRNIFRKGAKTNDLGLSISLSVTMSGVEHTKDVGDIMRQLNIGSGHKGAGAGQISCSSKDEMIRTKDKTLKKIIEMFREQ